MKSKSHALQRKKEINLKRRGCVGGRIGCRLLPPPPVAAAASNERQRKPTEDGGHCGLRQTENRFQVSQSGSTSPLDPAEVCGFFEPRF
jgi:hypothetical protein